MKCNRLPRVQTRLPRHWFAEQNRPLGSEPKGLLPGINEAIAKLLEENKVEEFIAIVDQIQGIEEVSAEAPEGYEADE